MSFLLDVKNEFYKMKIPSKQEIMNTSIGVFLAVLVTASLFLLFDGIARSVIFKLINL